MLLLQELKNLKNYTIKVLMCPFSQIFRKSNYLLMEDPLPHNILGEIFICGKVNKIRNYQINIVLYTVLRNSQIILMFFTILAYFNIYNLKFFLYSFATLWSLLIK